MLWFPSLLTSLLFLAGTAKGSPFSNGLTFGILEESGTLEEERVPTDYLKEFIEEPKGRTRRDVNSAIPHIEPELWIVLDYGNSKFFNFDKKKILEYLGVLIQAASAPFDKIKEFRTSFKITNITIVKSPKHNPYPLDQKVDTPIGPGILFWNEEPQWGLAGVSDGFINYVTKKLKGDAVSHDSHWVPDIPLLLVSERMVYNGTAPGKWTTVAGASSMGTVCNQEKEWANQAGVAFNTLGVPDGFTLDGIAYVIGTLLGADLDGEGDAKGCPATGGFLMGRVGNYVPGRSLSFSKCSVEGMLKTINGNKGTCLFNKSGQKELVKVTKNPLPGALFKDMTAFCNQRYPGFQNNRPSDGKTPDQLCNYMTCQFMNEDEKKYFDARGNKYAAPDGLPCAKGKACLEGRCIVVNKA